MNFYLKQIEELLTKDILSEYNKNRISAQSYFYL